MPTGMPVGWPRRIAVSPGGRLSTIIYVASERSGMTVKALKDLVVGVLVGVVSMLPGASGATIAVIFGIYERLISDLANIRDKLLRDLRFIIPVGLGIVIGLFVCAFGLDALMDQWEVPMMFFFAALILAQIPDIRDLGDDGQPMTAYNWAALVVGFLIMLAFLWIGLTTDGRDSAVDGALVWVLVGIVLVVSKLAPGISGSTVLLAVGLFTPLMDAMTEFDMSVLVPVLVGMIIGALAFAKVIDHFLANNRKSTYMVILGLTVGSVVTVGIEAALEVDGIVMAAECLVGIVVGLVLGVALSRIAKRYAIETIEERPESPDDGSQGEA